jgi:transposase
MKFELFMDILCLPVMEKEDARYQTLEQLHERRKQVVRLYKQGIKVMRIVEMVGLSYPTVRTVIDLFVQGGWAAIRPAGRGREPGQGRLLNDEQEHLIQRAIIDKRPEQLKLDFYLWSRSAVAQLIEQACGLKLSERTVGKYLKRWGFTPQKPIKKAYEQRPEAVKAWLDEHYPAIAAKAKAEGGEIHWGDETALTNTDVRGRGYAPVGKTPVSYVPAGKREKLSMIATVTNQGKARWMIVDEAFNADKLIEFLGALIKDTDKKVFLILDNLRVHHSKPVKAWLAARADRIEVFYLPSYSPELNPEERLNADLMQAIGKKVPVRTKAKLRDATQQHMTMLESNPERVRSFFLDQRVRYAA